MNKLIKLLVLPVAFVVLNSAINCAVAGNTNGISKNALTNGTSYTWYDGKRARTVWLNPKLVAEFDPGPADRNLSKSLAASATRINGKQRAIQLWRLKSGNNTGTAGMQRLRQAAPRVKISPVLQDGPSDTSRKRALPGNIIVHLDPNWDQQQVKAWFRQQALEMVKPLNIGPNIFVVKTGPGLEALEKANKIYLSGKVVAAYPDWWQEVSKR